MSNIDYESVLSLDIKPEQALKLAETLDRLTGLMGVLSSATPLSDDEKFEQNFWPLLMAFSVRGNLTKREFLVYMAKIDEMWNTHKDYLVKHGCLEEHIVPEKNND